MADETTSTQDEQMVYKPPPINPPSPTAMMLAWFGALAALGALIVFHLRLSDLAAGLAVAGQFLIALSLSISLSLAAMPYSGPPINPPVPPRRYAWLAAITIGALGVALLGLLRGSALGFVWPAALAVVTAVGFAFTSGRRAPAGPAARQ